MFGLVSDGLWDMKDGGLGGSVTVYCLDRSTLLATL